MSRSGTGGGFRGPDDLRLVARQIYYEQLNFWLNPIGALFTVGFSVVFLVLLASTAGHSRSSTLGGVEVIQYYVPGFIAYGVMAACFNMLANSIVVRREMGLLKRLRLSPLPTWAMLGAVFANSVIVSFVEVIVLLTIGKFGYHVSLPHNVGAFVLALLVGAASFSSIGVAISTLIPNQEAGGPIISIAFFVLLFLSGLWYPLNPNSGIAKFSSYFPIRHMITAVYAPFDVRKGVTGWAWHDLGVMALWGLGGAIVAARRWSWAPRQARRGGGMARKSGLGLSRRAG
jgi:ABC-2 type transport system permease protein